MIHDRGRSLTGQAHALRLPPAQHLGREQQHMKWTLTMKSQNHSTTGWTAGHTKILHLIHCSPSSSAVSRRPTMQSQVMATPKRVSQMIRGSSDFQLPTNPKCWPCQYHGRLKVTVVSLFSQVEVEQGSNNEWWCIIQAGTGGEAAEDQLSDGDTHVHHSLMCI